jgi:hypothetical protein
VGSDEIAAIEADGPSGSLAMLVVEDAGLARVRCISH